MKTPVLRLKSRQLVGKYRVIRRVGVGGFASVYDALDTVEGVRVALKVPHPHKVTHDSLEWFRAEARLHSALDHPNILPVKNAEMIDGHFVIVYTLGERSLGERLKSRLSAETFIAYAEQMLEAVAHAHSRNVIHCDLKPENFILYSEGRVRLADFTLAKIAVKTIIASGSGTVGYMAPEQAMGQTSFRSDVFSLGLIFYQMLTGLVPRWPFEWPLDGHAKLKRKMPAPFIEFLRRAISLDTRKRFPDGGHMLAGFRRLKPQLRRFVGKVRRRRSGDLTSRADWRRLRYVEFRRLHRNALELNASCQRCDGPIGPAMFHCPWCLTRVKPEIGGDTFPARCPRCRRGRKLDWKFCAWCYGPGFTDVSERPYSDRRYATRCSRKSCRGQLLPFSRYCPWCRVKVKKPWIAEGLRERCGRCDWAVSAEFWIGCPWCEEAARS